MRAALDVAVYASRSLGWPLPVALLLNAQIAERWRQTMEAAHQATDAANLQAGDGGTRV